MAILITHPPTENGKPTREGMENLFRVALPILDGATEVVTTGSFRSDSAGEELAQLLRLPLRKVPELGPIRALPLPELFSGRIFYSLIGSPEIARMIFLVWVLGLLPGCERPKDFERRVGVGFSKLGPLSVAIVHRETEAVRRVRSGEKPTLIQAIEGVSHLHVSFLNR